MHPKSPIDPHRVRYLPPQFSWIDQRLVRDHWVELCDPEALALYLFLATVADAQGLSFYSEASLCERLSLPRDRLRRARHWLVHLELIAFRAPVYQVLSLPALPADTAREVRSC
jgi:hypothetical protein